MEFPFPLGALGKTKLNGLAADQLLTYTYTYTYLLALWLLYHHHTAIFFYPVASLPHIYTVYTYLQLYHIEKERELAIYIYL